MEKQVEIIGGGLAGLSLAVGLASRDVPVRIREAGSYPRHRVCGEFILGLDDAEIAQLEIAPALATARLHHDCSWFALDKLIAERPLPMPARGISRYQLDQKLSKLAVEKGATVSQKNRVLPNTEQSNNEGTVLATGRHKQPGKWIGLKAHYLNLPLHCGLEMHLGAGGYVGLTQVEDNRVNVCALLPAPLLPNTPREITLPTHLARIGLGRLAQRLRGAEVDVGSVTGVSHFSLGWQKSVAQGTPLVIGDQQSMIPPFTGAGMSMAFQAAALSIDNLQAWSRNECDWPTAKSRIESELRRVFKMRMSLARLFHPLLLQPLGATVLSLGLQARIFPFNAVVRALRGR